MNISHKAIPKATVRRRGITLIEMALILPVLLFITLGIVQYGLVMDASNTLTSLGRAGARFAAIHADEGTPDQIDARTRDFIRQRARGTTILAGYNTPQEALPDAWITITGSNDKTAPNGVVTKDRSAGSEVRVQISYPMSRKMFVPPQMFGGQSLWSKTYTTSSVALIESVG